MVIGIPQEIKDGEHRVALTPEATAALIQVGHTVLVEENAGIGSGIKNDRYREAGALLIKDKSTLFQRADLIVKIKEPLPSEYHLFHPGQTVFTFFHFASNPELTHAMLSAQTICVAYETVETEDGRLPLLAPMSEIAGRMAPLVASVYLAKPFGGKGVLASPVAHGAPARFVILGAGTADRAAAEVALGIGGEVFIFERFTCILDVVKRLFPKATCLQATPESIEEHVPKADVLIGAVHIPGAPAPKIVSRTVVARMEKGSVIVDIAIDQGGCIATSRPTTHSDPVYIEEGILHYCVTNMPGIFPRTATYALGAATLPYVIELANKGSGAFKNQELRRGLNLYKGHVTHKRVAQAHGLPWADPKELVG